MHPSVLTAFERGLLTREEIADREVLEVGAADVNGSVRPILEAHRPASYLGVDMGPGNRVDRVLDATDLVDAFGRDAFDIVVSTEMLEHAADWRACLVNMATVLRPGGLLALTTRSPGFGYHPYPEDHWRFPVPFMRQVLEALGLEVLECSNDPDPASPGVFAKARKPDPWTPDLAELAGLEAEPVTGPGASGRPLTILGHPHQADGSGYYRYYLPFKHLARGSQHRVLLPEPGAKFFPDERQLDEIDVISGQRFMGPDGVMLWERWKGRVKLVYETDDDMLHPDSSSGLAHLHDIEVRESFKRCLAMSDMVTVSTEPLVEQMRAYNPRVRLLPNCIDADLLYLERPRRDRVTVGWAGGMSHLLDWMEAADPVREVLAAHPQVDMHFVGIDYSPLLKRTCRYTPWSPNVWTYFFAVDFDIGLAPLADTAFNTCKSHIKALEYMALGIPVIASDRPAYRDLVVDGVTGYLVRSQAEWAARLRDLVHDEAMRAEMGAKGREVAGGWTIQQGWKRWRDAYEEVTGWRS